MFKGNQWKSYSSAQYLWKLRIFVSFCPRLWPATCSSSFAAGIREGVTVTKTITSHVLRASRDVNRIFIWLFILKHKCYSVYMRLSGVFQRLFKIKKDIFGMLELLTAPWSWKNMCWQDAWQTSVIGIRSLQIGMFNFLSTQTCWFLSCVNSIPENYDFLCFSLFILLDPSCKIWVEDCAIRLSNGRAATGTNR